MLYASPYLGRAVAYTKELLRTYPDDDIERFEPSPLLPDQLARRALHQRSLLERLQAIGREPDLLDLQYRMHPV